MLDYVMFGKFPTLPRCAPPFVTRGDDDDDDDDDDDGDDESRRYVRNGYYLCVHSRNDE